MITSEIVKIYPDYRGFRDVYYDDFGNDVTPMCIELDRFADYCWINSTSWFEVDFRQMWGLIESFLKREDRQLNDCIETAFIESLEGRLIENSDIELIKIWVKNMPEFVYKISLEWRETRDKLRIHIRPPA